MLFFGLAACQPKGSLLYQFPTPENHQIDQVVLVIDYLNLKDDIGKYWDFDSHYHQQTLNQLLADADWTLQQSGYPKVNSYLISSGLLIKHDWPVEHYIKNQFQENLLYPPFILAHQGITQKHIDQHQEFLSIKVKYMGQRRHQLNHEHTHRGMQMGYHFESLDLPASTGILYLQIDQSAPGIIKQLGTVLISGTIASQADYAQMNLDLSNRRHASAFLVHKGSGQILWKNHSNLWSPDQPINQLLIQLPNKR